MKRTYEYTAGIQGIIEFCKKLNPEIGEYREHYLTQDGNFFVVLTQGNIIVPLNLADDFEDERDSVTDLDISSVLNSFVKTAI